MAGVYLIHFASMYHHARHYVGFTDDLPRRLTEHRAGAGSRLLAAVAAAGVPFDVAWMWPGATRAFERKVHRLKNTPRLCIGVRPTRTGVRAASDTAYHSAKTRHMSAHQPDPRARTARPRTPEPAREVRLTSATRTAAAADPAGAGESAARSRHHRGVMPMRAVANLPRRERPRARLARFGAAALTIPELLALVLGAAGDGNCAVGIGHDLLTSGDGTLRCLAGAAPGALTAVRGIGPARAAQLVAAFELARRWAAESVSDRPSMATAAEIAAVFAPRLQDLPVEEFHVGVLDYDYRLERDIRVTTGILDRTCIHPREVLSLVVGAPATAIVLVHNHPGGDPAPSAEDYAITEQLAATGHVLNIRVADHVIIGRDRYCSLRETGWL